MLVVRDEIACKPAVIAETKDYVAIASEFQAMAHLPGVNAAKIFEPEPGSCLFMGELIKLDLKEKNLKRSQWYFYKI